MTKLLIHTLKSIHIERTADNQGWDIKVAFLWGNGWTCFQTHCPEIPKEQSFYDRLHKNSHASQCKSSDEVIKFFPNLFENLAYERYTY